VRTALDAARFAGGRRARATRAQMCALAAAESGARAHDFVDKNRPCCQDRRASIIEIAAASIAGIAQPPPETSMDHSELAWEFADLFAELEVEQINELLAKNVPIGTLDFFQKYGEDFGKAAGLGDGVLHRLPNLLLMGYLIRVLEERLIDGEGGPEA
jgi:hypothetical protein